MIKTGLFFKITFLIKGIKMLIFFYQPTVSKALIKVENIEIN